jgi:nicotinamide mononucleotide adenylyltransferase
MTETGVVHGRFQIFHLDHLKYVLAAREKCRHLVVGITNPDPTLTKADAADPYRSSSAANPLTYFERYSIIRAVLLEAGLDQAEFSIVPFPINFPDLYHFYVPLDAVFYLTIYDDWGKKKLRLLQSLALNVEVLWVKSSEQKGISAKEVRRRMAGGEAWEHLVPPAAASVIKRMGIEARLSLSKI